MKQYAYLISLAIFSLLAFSSCNQEEQTGLVKFGLELTEETALKSAVVEPQVVAALVSVQDVNGSMILDKEHLELIRFGDQFVTRSLELPVGEYMLTEFMLINPDGIVRWATPIEGSPLAHLVRNPLPHHFGIHPDETTSMDIQVIRVFDYSPGDFGYAEFNIEFVNRFCLQVYFNCKCMEIFNDTTPAYDEPGAPILLPRLTIWMGDRPVVDEPMVPGLNQYNVPMHDGYYTFMAFGFNGESLFEGKFHLDELLRYRCGPDFEPLIINPEPDPGIIITPDGLQQPTIRQGVFGQITMPVDDVWSTEQYDVYPVVRDIYFFQHYVLDSIYTFAPMGCYIHEDMINELPVAIVRSNSDGYFQVPLEDGEYLYLVKLEEGYYIDAYISSHKPGQVIVYPGEVTELYIHVLDCSMWM